MDEDAALFKVCMRRIFEDDWVQTKFACSVAFMDECPRGVLVLSDLDAMDVVCDLLDNAFLNDDSEEEPQDPDEEDNIEEDDTGKESAYLYADDLALVDIIADALMTDRRQVTHLALTNLFRELVEAED